MIAMDSGRKAVALPIVAVVVLAVCLAFAGSASAKGAAWHLHALSMPANLPPGGSGKVMVTAADLGDAEVNGSAAHVKLIATLPPDLEAGEASLEAGLFGGLFGLATPCATLSPTVVECVFEETLPEYERLEAAIQVKVASNPGAGETNQITMSVSGGESYACEEVAAGTGKYTSSVCSAEGEGSFEWQSSGHPIAIATATQRLAVGSTPPSFGVESYELAATNEDGSYDKRAGSHPFGLTTTMDLNRTGAEPYVPAMAKDLSFRLPPGLVGNPTPFPQCSDVEFHHEVDGLLNTCPGDTAVGVSVVTIHFPGEPNIVTQAVPVFNLKPSPGEPARFGFAILGVPVILDTSVRTGEDYGVTVSIDNISQAPAFLSSEVTFWGVPGDPRHDRARGWECLGGGLYRSFGVPQCAPLGQSAPPPLLSMPTSCNGPLQSSVLADSWADAGSFTEPLQASFEPSMNGCNQLPFSPSITVAPDGKASSSPTGLTVGIHVPQSVILDPEGLAEADVKNTTVTLPAGVALNPAAADGLQACPLLTGKEKALEEREENGEIEGVNLESAQPASCPEASKVGLVRIKTPLLPNELTGEAYLAAQDQNPFGSLVALYVVAQDPVSGTLIKLAGEVKPDPVTGQLVSTFLNTPQLPFEDFKLEFFGGDRAPLGTPAACGAYTTTASIEPWSGNGAAESSSTFEIATGPNGSPCSDPAPFSPSLTVGTTSVQAGGFTPFTMTVSREDGQQNIQQLQLHMPPGLSGLLTGVELCGEAQANAGTCGANSLIGETTVSVGLGGDPYSVTGGKVYITGPYEGAPFGLSIVVPAKAGPYDLGQVVVRGKIEVDPITSALTVTTNSPTQGYAIPHILDGIPLQIKHVNFTTTRSGFTFNPTNCDPMGVTGSVASVEGSSSAVSVPFQVTNCAILAFKPGFKVSTSGKTSRANGASLNVKLTYPKAVFGSQANIKSVKVDLPKQLPSRLTTLQKACPAKTFEANPADCPVASIVGHATAITPLIPVPLTGPAYFVSYGGAKFPELVIVLQGYGVTLDLHGETFISKAGITSSTFHTIPDAPVGSFELSLPEGPFSALAANGNLCKSALKMPTAFTAQNGTEIHESTKISVTSCAKVKKKVKKSSKRHKGKSRGKKK